MRRIRRDLSATQHHLSTTVQDLDGARALLGQTRAELDHSHAGLSATLDGLNDCVDFIKPFLHDIAMLERQLPQGRRAAGNHRSTYLTNRRY